MTAYGRHHHHEPGGHEHGTGHGHDAHPGHSGHGHDDHGHTDHRGHGHDDHHHGHGEHGGHDHVEHGHDHGHGGHAGRPGGRELEHDLSALVAEAQHVDTEPGVRAFERLVAILTRPAFRIARARLEGLLSHGDANDDDINEVVFDAHYQLYKMLHRYIPGTPVMPWFATIVRSKASDFARRRNHARAKNRLEMTSYEDLALTVAAHEKDLYAWLDVQEVVEGLAPDDQQVLSLLHSGHTTAEIAVALGQTGPWVRARRKALRAAFCTAR